MAIPWGEIATGSVAGFALGWRIYDGIREKKLTKEYALKDNPDRCREHDLAIVEMKTDIKNIKEDVAEIKERLDK